ncbi:MAG: PilZ domain-containing protein [Acidobacteria bacterium]|nr:PilZ domain-containing protein [Acidobacteriota bacterium]
MLPTKEKRRYPRIPLEERVEITWEEERGERCFTRGRCLDASASGLRLEILRRIPVRSYINFLFETSGFGGSGCVRFCTSRGMKYLVGVEFTSGLLLDEPAKRLTSKRGQ